MRCVVDIFELRRSLSSLPPSSPPLLHFAARKSVLGALFGTQKGREVEIMNSFELLCTCVDGLYHIDKEYMEQKSEQCTWGGGKRWEVRGNRGCTALAVVEQ